MPLYEYLCRDCNQEFEVLVRGEEKPACPSCGQKHLTKKLSVPAAPVIASTGPVCPAKSAGACGMGGCGSGACGML